MGAATMAQSPPDTAAPALLGAARLARALQTRRPCQIRRWPARIQRSCGPQRHQIFFDLFFGSLARVMPSRPANRPMWVSTTTPLGMPNAVPSTTLAVLRTTPSSAISSAIVRGTAPRAFDDLFARLADVLGLVAIKPVEWISPLALPDRRWQTRPHRDSAQRGGASPIDPLVGALRGQDHRHQRAEAATASSQARSGHRDTGDPAHRGSASRAASVRWPGVVVWSASVPKPDIASPPVVKQTQPWLTVAHEEQVNASLSARARRSAT